MPFLDFRHTSCCLCLSLKTGCKIIGGLDTFLCALALLSFCHKLIELLEKGHSCSDKLNYFETNDCPHKRFVQLMVILLDITILVIGFIGSVLLLYGMQMKRPKLFVTWLIFSGLVILNQFITTFVFWLNPIKNLFIIPLHCHFFLVVRSYQLQLYDEVYFSSNGCPVVAVTLPQESEVQVIVPSQQCISTSYYNKDDPTPPYPGPPRLNLSEQDRETPPPPYSVAVSSYSNGQFDPAEASSSLCQDEDSNHQIKNMS